MKFVYAVCALLLLSACDRGADSPRGFSLPKGDVVRGEEVFLSYDCLSCHQLDGYGEDFPNREMEEPVALGGKVTQVKTYAELVTSVINPSHKIARGYEPEAVTDDEGQSKMRNYNDVMTVTELINLVAFLQPHYELRHYPETTYPMYHP